MALVIIDDKHYKRMADSIRDNTFDRDLSERQYLPEEMGHYMEHVMTEQYSEGIQQGKAEGYEGGRETGRLEGYEEGYENGFEDGRNQGVRTVIDDSTSLSKNVPSNSINCCYLKSIGGMSAPTNNLIPFPFRGMYDVGFSGVSNGVTMTINEDRSITLNGATGEKSAGIVLVNFSVYPDVDWYLSANHISGEWPDGVSVQGSKTYLHTNPNNPTIKIPAGTTNTYIAISVAKNTSVNNLTFKPMLSAKEPLPYEDYYEGTRDNKLIAIKSYDADKQEIAITPIPESYQSLEGYGKSDSYIDFERDVFVYGEKETALPEPFNPLLKVKEGGSLGFITDNGGAVPSTVIYQIIAYGATS